MQGEVNANRTLLKSTEQSFASVENREIRPENE